MSEAPADGAANEAVIRLMAQALKVPKGSVRMISGHASRYKRLEVPTGESEVRKILG